MIRNVDIINKYYALLSFLLEKHIRATVSMYMSDTLDFLSNIKH